MLKFNRSHKSFFNRPVICKNSIVQSESIHRDNSCPLSYSSTGAFVRNNSISSGIISLLNGKSPYTVFRRISQRIIDSFNRVFFTRLFSHISKKCSTKADAVPFDFSTRIFSGGSTNYCNTVECLTNKIYKTHKLFSVKVTLKRVVAMLQRNHVQPLNLATIGV